MSEPVENYLDSLFAKDSDLERVLEGIRERGMPEISVAPAYGRLLTLLATLARPHDVLEIGALGGYSAICLLRGMPPEGRLTSLEIREDYAEFARGNLAAAGYKDRSETVIGDASGSLERFVREGRRFDFFFIDADKENYPHYLEQAIRLARPGALIAADNTLLRGRTIDPGKEGPSVMAMREFNRRIAQDPRLTGAHLPAYDGLALAVVK
ncbi:O-methyltransferase [Cohnella sp. CFH 77786]|uniref:O-methyltransferase n=1 Tax=Cohnella sp. CFH 77786 TaxID=2662265 RepID=UPI001C60B901|nr:O-methyltransferase [Cohnella sp. CFH 77786]MBW5445025.1 O-methyltransferase [Cohnella sp. CFH 77786]